MGMGLKKELVRQFVFWAIFVFAAVGVYLWFGGRMDARGLQVSLMGALIVLLCFYLGVVMKGSAVRLALRALMLAATIYLYLSAFRVIEPTVDIRLVQACILAVLAAVGLVHFIGSRSASRLSRT